MRSACKLVVTLSIATALGCGGDDGPRSLGGDIPDCAEGELIVQGELDGASVDQQLTGYNAFTFENAVGEASGNLIVGFPSQSNILVEFPDFADDNDIVRARGFVNFEATGGPRAGFCDTMTQYSGELLVPLEGEQWEFTMSGLRPGTQPCLEDPLPGELYGCFRERPAASAL